MTPRVTIEANDLDVYEVLPRLRRNLEAEGIASEIVGPDGNESDAELGIGEVIDRALRADVECKAAVRDAGTYLGLGVRQLVQMMDPELVVIGGVLSKAGDVLLNEIRAQVAEDARTYPGRDLRILGVEDYEKSALYGGYALLQHPQMLDQKA